MSNKPLTIQLRPRGKKIPKLPVQTTIYLQGSGAELYQRIASQSSFSVYRLRITNADDGKPILNDKNVSLESAGLHDGSTLRVKDLGPQIAWRTVFLIEYLGPLLIHPLFLYIIRPHFFSAAARTPTSSQTLTCALVTLHFAKRELETLFVHRFSAATMPLLNIFKNSAHYWLLSGLLIAFTTYSPTSWAATANPNPLATYSAVALYALSELANLHTHLVLRSLRSPGGTERGVPRSRPFEWVTCPNYMFEVAAWLAMLIVSRSWGTAVFIGVATAQMGVWAKKKESRYRKESGPKYRPKRFVMIPGLW